MTLRLVSVFLVVFLASPLTYAESPEPSAAKAEIERKMRAIKTVAMGKHKMKPMQYLVNGAGGPYAKVTIIIPGDGNNAAAKAMAQRSVDQIVEYLALTNDRKDLNVKVIVVKKLCDKDVGRAVYDHSSDTAVWKPGVLW